MRQIVAAVEIAFIEHVGYALNRRQIKITITIDDADLGGALQTKTVPQFIMNEIQDARRFRGDRDRAKGILDKAYPIDPAHPLIHLALAMVEDHEQPAAFLRDYDLKRLPGSCAYAKDLDPKDVLKLAAGMCAEQGDEERAQMARDKLKTLEP